MSYLNYRTNTEINLNTTAKIRDIHKSKGQNFKRTRNYSSQNSKNQTRRHTNKKRRLNCKITTGSNCNAATTSNINTNKDTIILQNDKSQTTHNEPYQTADYSTERLNLIQIQKAIDDFPVPPPHRIKFNPPRIRNQPRWTHNQSQLNSYDTSNEIESEPPKQPIAGSRTQSTPPRPVAVYSPPRVLNQQRWHASQLNAPKSKPKPKSKPITIISATSRSKSARETIGNKRPQTVATYSKPRVINTKNWRLSQCIFKQSRSIKK